MSGAGAAAPLSGSVRRGAAAPRGAHHRCCAMGPHAITVQVLPRHSSRRRDSAAWRSTPRCRSRATATKIERGCGAAGVPSRVAVRSRAMVALYAAAPASGRCAMDHHAIAVPVLPGIRCGDGTLRQEEQVSKQDGGNGRAAARSRTAGAVPHGDVRCRRFAILCHAILLLFPPSEFVRAVLFCGQEDGTSKQVKGDRAAD